MRLAGIEPTKQLCRWILSPVCLPISPQPHLIYSVNQNSISSAVSNKLIGIGKKQPLSEYFL